MTMEIASLYATIGANISNLQKGLDQSKNFMQQAGATMTSVGTKLTAAVTVPLVGVGLMAAKTAADYQKNMNIMEAVSGANTEQMRKLDAMAKELGADITLPGTSASDAAEAMTELFKAGLSVNDVMAASRGVLQMSTAGNLSNAEAAAITANALNAFGLEGKEATRIADLFAGAANASAGDVKDFGDSFKMAGSVLAMTGVSIEDGTTALSLMANAGIKGSDAGTSLKSMFMALMSPTNKASELMESLGINVYDAQGNMKSFPSLIENFSGALKGMTGEQRNAALATMFGTDGIRAANIVLMGGVDKFEKMKGAVTKQGAAANLAAARTKGLAGAFDGLQSTVETAMLTAIEPFLPKLEALVRGAGDLVAGFQKLDPSAQGMVVIFGALAAAVGPMLVIMGTLATAIGAIGLPVLLLLAGVALLAAAWAGNWGNIQGITTKAVSFISSIVQTWLSKVQDLWANHGERIVQDIKFFLSLAATIVGQVLGAITQVFGGSGVDVIALVHAWFDTVFGIYNTALTLIVELVESVLVGVANWWYEHGEEVIATITTFMQQAQSFIGGALTFISGVVQTALAGIAVWWKDHGANVMAIVGALAAAVVTNVTTWLAQMQLAISTGMAIIQQFWKDHGATITASAKALWDGLTAIFNVATALITGIVDVFGQLILGNFDGAKQAFETMVRVMWDNILKLFDLSVATGLKILMGFAGKVGEMAGRFFDEAGKLGKAVIQGIQMMMESMGDDLIEWIIRFLKRLIDAAKAAVHLGSPSKDFMFIGKQMMAGLTVGIRSGVGAAVDAAESAMQAVLAAGEGAADISLSGARGSTAGSSRTINTTGDTFHITVNDESAGRLLLAMIEERRAGRLNASMGV